MQDQQSITDSGQLQYHPVRVSKMQKLCIHEGKTKTFREKEIRGELFKWERIRVEKDWEKTEKGRLQTQLKNGKRKKKKMCK